MRRVDQLITRIGELTENPRADVSETMGISDEPFVQALNDAQTRLQTIILRDYPHYTGFDTLSAFTSTAGTKTVPIPTDAFYKGMVRRVEFATTSEEQSYYDLDYAYVRGISRAPSQFPSQYALQGENIILGGIPSTTGYPGRITYVRQLDRLDRRRGLVEAQSNDATDYQTITIDVDDATYDATNLADNSFICVNTPLGEVEYYNIEYTDFDSSSGVLTLASGVAMADGTITVGSYVTIGKYTTNTSKLFDACERYLIAYSKWEIFKLDSSVDSSEQNEELGAIELDILAAVANQSLDLQNLPITEPEWLDY